MVNAETMRNVEMPERLCYYCNEGNCAQCSGWDRTIVDGEIVVVACAHECRGAAQKKTAQSVPSDRKPSHRSA